MPKTGRRSIRPKAVGLPGLTAMPWKMTSPMPAITSMMRSRSPTELPPEKTSRSSPAAASTAARQRVEIVGSRRVDGRHTAVGADDGGERELVDVVELARAERLPGLDDLVAGRQDRDARPGEDVDLGQAHGGERADAARRQHVAGREAATGRP